MTRGISRRRLLASLAAASAAASSIVAVPKYWRKGGRPIYSNRVIREMMDVKAIRDRNVLLRYNVKITETYGRSIGAAEFRGIALIPETER